MGFFFGTEEVVNLQVLETFQVPIPVKLPTLPGTGTVPGAGVEKLCLGGPKKTRGEISNKMGKIKEISL